MDKPGVPRFTFNEKGTRVFEGNLMPMKSSVVIGGSKAHLQGVTFGNEMMSKSMIHREPAADPDTVMKYVRNALLRVDQTLARHD